MAAYMANRRANRRLGLIAWLGGKCVRCGTTVDLQFDHKDPSTMAFRLNGSALDKPWLVLVAEARKCQLLCPPHHIEKSRENGEFGGGWNKIDGPEGFAHGTESGYMRGGCRKDCCRKARHDARVLRGELKGTRGHYQRSGVAQSGRVADC